MESVLSDLLVRAQNLHLQFGHLRVHTLKRLLQRDL